MRTRSRTLLLSALLVVGVVAAAACVPLTGVAQVAAGRLMACAVKTDGTVVCWGEGLLGDGAQEAGRHPVGVAGIDDAVQVAVGDRYACARRAGGSVSCWGYGTAGQLGNGAFSDQLVPVAVTGISTAVDLDAYGTTTCAVLSGGTVRCWGDNTAGKLGNGVAADSATPLTIPGIADAWGVAVLEQAVCVTRSTLEVSCWGANGFGQLGNPAAGTVSYTPVLVSGVLSATEIDGGQAHACARLTDGTARCWGYNLTGQLGDGTTANRTTPVAVTGLSGVARLDAGKLHTCASLNDGSVRCWGQNAEGAVDPEGTAANKLTPLTVTDADLVPLADVTAVTGGQGFTCAMQSSAQIRCWGRNVAGELGRGSTSSEEGVGSPVVNRLVEGQEDLATSGEASCAVVGGAVQCWGSNLDGQLGDGTTTSTKARVTVPGITTATDVEVSLGGHACAIVGGGQVRCWGDNTYGQLGDGTTSTTPVTAPVTVSSISSAEALALGLNHSCALLDGGEMVCWGRGTSGQLGDGAAADSSVPVLVSTITDVVDVTAGSTHTCAVDAGKQAWCWGSNLNGRLGDGTTDPADKPVAVVGLASGATGIAAGLGHTCAVVGAGQVWCWGLGTSGQLGNGLFASSLVPVQASGLTSAVDVAVGTTHSCALLAGQTARCWGNNSSGQVGDGVGSGTPSSPAGLIEVTQLVAGGDSSAARLTDGTARGWGENYWGPLGDHSSADRFTPVGMIQGR